MITATIELPENLGGKFQLLFLDENQKQRFTRFMKFIATVVIIDGKTV